MTSLSDIVKSVPQSAIKVIKNLIRFDPPLLGVWMAHAAIQPKWLIEDFLQADSNILISGPAKRGKKSYLAFNMALCVASGQRVGPFNSAVGGPAPVLILEAEGGTREAYQRILRVCNGVKLDYNALPIFFSHRENIILTKAEWSEAVAEFVKSRKVRLVIVDTLRLYMGGDENSSEQVSIMTRAINEIREAGASVIFIHHVNKPSAVDKDPDDEIRGSSAIAGFYDVHYAIRCKDGQPFDNVLIRSKDDGDRFFEIFWSFTGENECEAASFELLAVSPEKRLARVSEEILMHLAVKEGVTHPASIRNTLRLPEEKINEGLDLLVKQGKVIKTGQGYMLSRGGLSPVEE